MSKMRGRKKVKEVDVPEVTMKPCRQCRYVGTLCHVLNYFFNALSKSEVTPSPHRRK